MQAMRLSRRRGCALRAAFGGYPAHGLSLFFQNRLQP
jgi:hypothetical protein